MQGPLIALRFVHNSVRCELAELERALDGFEEIDSQERALLVRRFAEFEHFLKDHEHGEEQVLFPAVESKAAHVARAYEMDHRANDAISDQIARLLDFLAGPGADHRAAQQLRLANAAMRANLELHLKKEEDHLVAVAEQLFGPDEQGMLVGRLAGATPPDQQFAVHSFVLSRLGVDDLEGLLRVVQAVAPPPAVQGIATIASRVVSGANWAAVLQRLPNLPQPAAVGA